MAQHLVSLFLQNRKSPSRVCHNQGTSKFKEFENAAR